MSFERIETPLPGCLILKAKKHTDNRGIFIKTYQTNDFTSFQCDFTIREQYYSISKRNTLRGMHFQTPPYDCEKMVYVTNGDILDVVLDLRKQSPSFGTFYSHHLTDLEAEILIIPKGCAHGFVTLSAHATVMYNVSSVFKAEHDMGIAWNSFDFSWPVEKPILSSRDINFPRFKDFESMF